MSSFSIMALAAFFFPFQVCSLVKKSNTILYFMMLFSKCFDMLGDQSCTRGKSNGDESVALLKI